MFFFIFSMWLMQTEKTAELCLPFYFIYSQWYKSTCFLHCNMSLQ